MYFLTSLMKFFNFNFSCVCVCVPKVVNASSLSHYYCSIFYTYIFNLFGIHSSRGVPCFYPVINHLPQYHVLKSYPVPPIPHFLSPIPQSSRPQLCFTWISSESSQLASLHSVPHSSHLTTTAPPRVTIRTLHTDWWCHWPI